MIVFLESTFEVQLNQLAFLFRGGQRRIVKSSSLEEIIMDKDTKYENFGPSHYDYDFDFDVDLRLNPIDYFLIVPYVLVIFPMAWVNELVMSRIGGYSAGGNIEESEEDSRSEELLGTYCLWPRHSHG